MSNILIFLTIFFTSVALPIQLHADTVVKVGIYNNDPLVFFEEDGKGLGIFIDILEYVADKEGWRIEYVSGNWRESLLRLEKSEIDILSTIAYSKERDKRFDFNNENVLTNWGQLYTRMASDIRGITDVAGKKIAFLTGDIHHTVFTELLDKFEVECELVALDDYHSVLEMVATGKVDGGIVNRMFGMRYSAKYQVDKSGIIFNPITIHYAAPEGKNSKLLATLDSYIQKLKSDEESVYYRSLDRWLGTLSPGKTFPSWLTWSLGTTGGMLILLFMGNMILRRKVFSRTRALTSELRRREETEKALQVANTIINRSPAVAFLWRNSDGWPVEFVSENVLDLLGYSSDEFTSGKISYVDVLHPEDADRVAGEVASFSSRAETTEFVHEPYRVITKNAEVRWLDDRTYIRRDAQGCITHFEGIVIDVSDSVAAAEALRLNKEKMLRSKKMESLGLLAGGVAHDLNNVLSGIVSYPDLLLLELPEDSHMHKSLRTIKASGERAVAIVQDLLTVARGVATIKEPLNINSLVAEHLDSPEYHKLKHFHPGVIVKTDLDDALLNIKGCSVHIRKVVMNLISNGAEAINTSGCVTIRTSNRYVDKTMHGYVDISTGEYAVLTVEDDGSGISDQDLERIFEPFYTKK
ncbi:MAG: PAS domain-containing protein, partial [Desulforhopalus sp.]